jgi:hypothetical protein
LDATGEASVAHDTLVLHGSHMLPTASALYLQGSAMTAAGTAVPLADGLRCIAGSLIRLGTKINVAGASGYGAPLGDIPISVRGAVPPTGTTLYYQIVYRDPAGYCTSGTYNLSNALRVVWAP